MRVNKYKYENVAFTDDAFWGPLSTLIDFLTPYQTATDTVQSDDATLGDVHRQFAGLMARAWGLPASHLLAPVEGQLSAIISAEWENHVNTDAVILCCLFNFDTAAYRSFPEQERVDADDWFTAWGTKLIKYYDPNHGQERALTQALEQQRSEFLAREGLFHSLDQRRTTMGEARGPSRRWPAVSSSCSS